MGGPGDGDIDSYGFSPISSISPAEGVNEFNMTALDHKTVTNTLVKKYLPIYSTGN